MLSINFLDNINAACYKYLYNSLRMAAPFLLAEKTYMKMPYMQQYFSKEKQEFIFTPFFHVFNQMDVFVSLPKKKLLWTVSIRIRNIFWILNYENNQSLAFLIL